MRNTVLITQIGIVIIHFIIAIWFRVDRDNAAESINERVHVLDSISNKLNAATLKLNQGLKGLSPKLDSLIKLNIH